MININNDVTQLDSSLDNIDIRYTSANGAEWRERGADTWNPFSGKISIICGTYNSSGYGGPSTTISMYGVDGERTLQQNTDNTSATISMLNSLGSSLIDEITYKNEYHANIKLAKAGYYILENDSYAKVYHNIGDIIDFPSATMGTWSTVFIYLGDN